MEYGLIIVFLLFLILYRVEKNNYPKFNVEDIQFNADELRGVFAILIIVSHTTLSFENIPMLLMPFSKISTICVGYFFVLSGYGLAWSNKNKNGYLKKNFLSNKILYIFIVSILVYSYKILVNYLEFILFNTDAVSVSLIEWWNTTNWYLKMQLTFYILFFVIFRTIKNSRKASIILGITTFIFCIVLCMNKLVDRSYFISELCFPFGVMLFEFKDYIEKIINKHYKCVILGMVCCGILSLFSFLVRDYSFLDFLLHNTLNIVVYFFIMIVLFLFRFENNILAYLKNISFEMYLCQFAIFDFLRHALEYYENEIGLIYVFGALVLDLMIALIMKKVNRIVKSFFTCRLVNNT